MGKNRNRNYNVNFRMSDLFPQVGFVAGIFITIAIFSSIFTWLYLLAAGNTKVILIMEAVINGIVLLGHLYMICRLGYEDFKTDFKITFAIEIVMNIVGFYICGMQLLAPPVGDVTLLYGFIEFIILIPAVMVVTLLPSMILCFISWFIMAMFGKVK